MSNTSQPGPAGPAHTPMISLPGGPFQMGTAPDTFDQLQQTFGFRRRDLVAAEAPQHEVWLAPFAIDVYPVTNVQFKQFLDDRPAWTPVQIDPQRHNGTYLQHWDGATYPPDLACHPVVYVCWYAAAAYAQWAGKRLPTEAEWEYAARGGLSEASFPWGDAPADPSRANYGESGIGATTPAGSYPPNPYGLYDMAGNVWEFCLDEWQDDFYARSPREDPRAGTWTPDLDVNTITSRRVIRGGSWGGSPLNLRVAYRDSHPPIGAGPHVGFRCARTAV